MLVALAACTSGPEPRPEPLAALPAPSEVSTDRFRDGEACGQCHLVPDATTAVLHDRTGANVSPVLLWRSSVMGLAARDPFYLAVFAEERAKAPARAAQIDAVCVRCHAPAGAEESGNKLGFDDLVAGTSPAAVLGRGGVTCSLCHQIDPANLGDERSFTGGFAVGYQRKIYGRYAAPETNPMMLIVNYTPTGGDHIAKSELCATCHTVIVKGSAGDVVEQATYLEWRSSRFAQTGQSCQTCHVVTTDANKQDIITPVSVFPNNLSMRSPVGRHDFVGANAYLLGLLATATEWLGAGIPASELTAAAARDAAHLTTAAKLTIGAVTADGFAVTVENLTGHKLPTGYPSRRMWLHVRVEQGGAASYESGAVDARGAILGADQKVVGAQNHHDQIRAAGEVQIWEAALADASGARTHRALDAVRYSKDDRIVPAGFAPTGTDVGRTGPIGLGGDTNFQAGSDTVTFAVPVPAGATVRVQLMYQSISPEIVDAIDSSATPAATRFVDLARAVGDAPTMMAQATATR